MAISSKGLALAAGALSIAVLVGSGPGLAQSLDQTQTAKLSDDQRRCLAEASRVKRDYIKYFGGDHVFYDFGERSTEASALCENGDVDEAWDLMAEIKSDIRALRNEQSNSPRRN